MTSDKPADRELRAAVITTHTHTLAHAHTTVAPSKMRSILNMKISLLLTKISEKESAVWN